MDRDRSGKGFVSHATNPNCTFEQGERDDFRIWRRVHNNDNGSLVTGDVKLPEGAVIRIQGEDQDRTVNYVMGSNRNGWRACTAGHGAVPTGDIDWRIVSFGPNDPNGPTTSPPPPPTPPGGPIRARHKWFDFHTWKGVAEFIAALLTIIGFISAFVAWAFFKGK